MISTNESKGGDYRVAIRGAADSDSFVLPAGHILETVTIKELDNTGGNISMGVDAKFETSTLQFTFGPDSAGNIRVRLGGSNTDIAVAPKTVTVPITGAVVGAGTEIDVTIRGVSVVTVTVAPSDNTAAKVATAIAGATYPAHITAEVVTVTSVKFTYEYGYWDNTFAIDLGTTGVTIGTIAEAGQGTLIELLTLVYGQTWTGYTVINDGANTLTFTKIVFGNITDLVFTDTGSTGTAAIATTTVQGLTGEGVVAETALSGTANTLTTLSLVIAGKVQSMTADATIYINIDTGALVDVFVTMQQLT